MLAFATILIVISCVFLAVPIAYTFLRLTGKIGPENNESAAILGVFLWIGGLIGFGLLISWAGTILNISNL